jgi:hypothetical protein
MYVPEKIVFDCQQCVDLIIKSNTWKEERIFIDGVYFLELWTDSEKKFSAIINSITKEWCYIPFLT